MTKKDYTKFAEMLRSEVNTASRMRAAPTIPEKEWTAGWQAAVNHIVTVMADVFEADNPKFDRDRFDTAIYASELARKQ